MYDFKNLKWEKNNSSTVKYIYINKNKNKIYKKYKQNSSHIKNIKKNYDKIKYFDFVPKMEFFEEENIIVEDYYNCILHIFNRPNDYIYQLLNIHDTLIKNNIYQNNYKFIHFYIHNNKIKLIDWNNMTFNYKKNKFFVNNNIYTIILFNSLDIIILFILIIINILKKNYKK